MTRRLLGYVVKLPDGTRSPRTQKPVPLADIVTPWLSGGAAEPHVVVPVFATRKPKPAPADGAADAPRPVAWDVVGDDGLALACDDEEHADRVLAEHGGRKRALYEVPPSGAHEAAREAAYERGKTDALRNVHALGTVEAARREERERIVRGVIAAFAKYDRECWARIDGSAYSTGAITGCRNRFMAVVTGDEEAAKGQAK